MRLQKNNELQLHDAVIIRRDADGKSHVVETTDITPGRGAMGVGIWGLLFGTLFAGPLGGLVVGAASAGGGALYAKLVDHGIKDATVARAAHRRTAGTHRAGPAGQPPVGRRPAERAGPLPRRDAGRVRPAAGRRQRRARGAQRGQPAALQRRAAAADLEPPAGGSRSTGRVRAPR